MRRARAVIAAVLIAAAPAAAQEMAQGDLSLGQVQSAVLIVDTERLFAESQFGQRVAAELRTATEALAAENREIEAALTAEERSLTERRPAMAVEAFRAAADDFDTRVQGIRAAQDAKERALQESVNAGREDFLNAVAPVMGELMRASGAAVILDRRTVFLALGAIDITDEAIAAIDAAIGDGASGAPGQPDDNGAPDIAPAGSGTAD